MIPTPTAEMIERDKRAWCFVRDKCGYLSSEGSIRLQKAVANLLAAEAALALEQAAKIGDRLVVSAQQTYEITQTIIDYGAVIGAKRVTDEIRRSLIPSLAPEKK